MKSGKQSNLWKWQQKCKEPGAVCRCGSRFHLTVEHIIPVFFLEVLGLKEYALNDEENFEIACRYCNAQKAHGFDHHNPKTIPLLKKYLALYEQNVTV
jgi:5-methylcytosine-specific restriction endonuclease McrA